MNRSILSWNVRGVRSSSGKRARVSLALRQLRPDIICLQEHKCHRGDMSSLLNMMGRHFAAIASSSGRTSGGTMIAWRMEVPVTYSAADKFGRWAIIKWLEGGQEWGIVNVYAPNEPSRRGALWATIRHKLHSLGGLQVAWLLLGDFNMVERVVDCTGPGTQVVQGFEKAQWSHLL